MSVWYGFGRGKEPPTFNTNLCTVQRVWTVLEEKNIPYQYIEVNPYLKPDSLLKLNPRGLVLTLQYENKPLYESTAICEFLLEDAYPGPWTQVTPPRTLTLELGRGSGPTSLVRASIQLFTAFCSFGLRSHHPLLTTYARIS